MRGLIIVLLTILTLTVGAQTPTVKSVIKFNGKFYMVNPPFGKFYMPQTKDGFDIFHGNSITYVWDTVTIPPPVQNVLPTVTTQGVSGITNTSAIGNGNVTSLGLPNPTQFGFVWGTFSNPTVAVSTKTEQGARTTTGAFSANLSGLTLNTTYYVRAYATNAAGTVYGSQVSFITTNDVPSVGNINVLYSNNFDSEPLGAWTRNRFYATFGPNCRYQWGTGERNSAEYFDPKSVSIIADGSGKYFHATYLKGLYGNQTGFSLKGELGDTVEEAYLSCNIRMKPGFQPVDGGKFPGLEGGTIVVPNVPGPDGGFSCIELWNKYMEMQSYTYHQGQPVGDRYGEGGEWFGDQLTTGVWFNLTIRVVMNTVGQSNGIYEGFLNGKLAFTRHDCKFRSSLRNSLKQKVGIHKFCWQSFFGGGDVSYAPIRDEWIDYDDLVIYTYKSSVNVPKGTAYNVPGNIIPLSNFPKP